MSHLILLFFLAIEGGNRGKQGREGRVNKNYHITTYITIATFHVNPPGGLPSPFTFLVLFRVRIRREIRIICEKSSFRLTVNSVSYVSCNYFCMLFLHFYISFTLSPYLCRQKENVGELWWNDFILLRDHHHASAMLLSYYSFSSLAWSKDHLWFISQSFKVCTCKFTKSVVTEYDAV